MSETKFTEGPWEIKAKDNHHFRVVNPKGDAEMGNWMVAGDVRWPENAALIAAAPELYAELAEIVSRWGFPNTEEWHRANNALKKARGES